jgi:hypothetical protein
MGDKVTTRFLGADEYPEWATFVAGAPAGSVYSLPEYLDALCTATGGSFRVLVAECNGRIEGGIALYEFAGRCLPRLLLYYNGIVLADHDDPGSLKHTEARLHTLGALETALSALPYSRIRFKSRWPVHDLRVFQAEGWVLVPHWSYEIDIGNLEDAWKGLDKNLRRLVRRGQEAGLACASEGDFDAFYRLHRATAGRKGAPLYLAESAYRRFVSDLRARKLARLYEARLPDGKVVSSQLVLTGPHAVTHTVCAGSDEEALPLGASAFLRWAALEDLAAAGYHANDLTDAALNPVTRFKAQFGGELRLFFEASHCNAPTRQMYETAYGFAAWTRRYLRRRIGTHASHRPTR